MNVDQILTVAGSIFLKFESVNARALANLSEESDFNSHLGLSHNDLEIAVSEIENYYQVDLGKNALENTNMKFWIDTILKLKGIPSTSNKNGSIQNAA